MKKLITILTTLTLLLNTAIVSNASAGAAEPCAPCGDTEIVDLGDGYTVEYEITEINPNARASTKTYTKTATCKTADGVVIAIIKLTGTFSYTGSSATCTRASSSYNMYQGWTYSNRSTTCSGNTAKTSARLSKDFYVDVNVVLTCSNTGVIS